MSPFAFILNEPMCGATVCKQEDTTLTLWFVTRQAADVGNNTDGHRLLTSSNRCILNGLKSLP